MEVFLLEMIHLLRNMCPPPQPPRVMKNMHIPESMTPKGACDKRNVVSALTHLQVSVFLCNAFYFSHFVRLPFSTQWNKIYSEGWQACVCVCAHTHAQSGARAVHL